MPFLDGLLRVLVEALVVRTNARLHPGRLVAQHQVHPARRNRQVRIDRGREGMDELAPARVPQPQSRAALGAEVPAGLAGLAMPVLVGDIGLMRRPGDKVRLKAAAKDIYLIDPESGRVILPADSDSTIVRLAV